MGYVLKKIFKRELPPPPTHLKRGCKLIDVKTHTPISTKTPIFIKAGAI